MTTRNECDRAFNSLLIVLFIILIAIAVSTKRSKGADLNAEQAKFQIGYHVFFDQGVCSIVGTMSCASCHNPDPKFGWSDGRKKAVGATGIQGNGFGLLGIRRVPSLEDCFVLENQPNNSDGRAPGLSSSCFQAIADPLVLGMPNVALMVQRVNSRQIYRDYAAVAYNQPQGVGEEQLRECMVTFLKRIRVRNLPADRLEVGLPTGLPNSAIRGREIFQKWCVSCHRPEHRWQDFGFHNIGVASRSRTEEARENQIAGRPTDLGRATVTGKDEDRFKWRTRGLVDCAKRPPYMHNGSFKDLPEVIHFFARGGKYIEDGKEYYDQTAAPEVLAISMTPAEESDLLSYVDLAFQTSPEDYPFFENPFLKKEGPTK